jgi:hypothetical protein
MGRFMFIFAQITSASQEGSRFGSENPIQVIKREDGTGSYADVLLVDNTVDCNIVTKAWDRMVMVPRGGHWDDPAGGGVDITVAYDGGTETTPCNCTITSTNADFSVGSDRVRVTAIYRFHFLTGILDRFVPAAGLPMQMTSARTILRDQHTQPASPQCETP